MEFQVRQVYDTPSVFIMPMKKLLLSLAFASTLLTGCLQSETLTEEQKALPTDEVTTFERSAVLIDKDQSYLSFTGTKQNFTVSHQCEFEVFNVQITLDSAAPTDLTKAQVTLDIDMKSLKTDSDGLTKHLLGADFFDTEKFPKAAFVSKTITSTGGMTYDVTGDLTIRDQTKTITFASTITNDYAIMKHTLDRMDFGVGAPDKVDDPIPVELKLVFQ